MRRPGAAERWSERRRRAAWAFALLAPVLVLACGERTPPRPAPPSLPDAASASYVGSARCATCHPGEFASWRGSHHDRAMGPVDDEHLRGDFENAVFSWRGKASRFTRDAEGAHVRTEGPDGKEHDYPIAYTFGWEPCQQFLVRFPDGKLQALGIAWDARPEEAGGQRWYHLYPEDPPPPGDALHWTGRQQTWNHQCADCHSTGLERRYDPARDAYDTRWAELDVACEACHGPGSSHLEWAEAGADPARGDRGLVASLRTPAGAWVLRDEARGIAQWEGPPRGEAQLDACAPCHSRRGPLRATATPGAPFLDEYRPALLREGLYHADGQILDEVYVWGSFVQSRMHAAGVRCTDCHDPHSARVRAPGNALCTQCHAAPKFDTPEHHHHAAGTPGAQCVDCHMPTRTYMVVDPRRDHSFSIPRPELSLELGTPNACESCHAERGKRWAADAVRAWRGSAPPPRPSFARALAAGRRGSQEAERLLRELIRDTSQPAIARATALELLAPLATPASAEVLVGALRDGDALVRSAAFELLEVLLPTDPRAAGGELYQARLDLASNALDDPVRLVRIAAARALLEAPEELLDPAAQRAFRRAFEELVAAEMALAERPESWVNLANLHRRRGDLAEARRDLEHALRLDPDFVPALFNLGDLLREQGRDDLCEAQLERARRLEPSNADVLHALGLLRVRQGRRDEGREFLRRAHEVAPENSGYAYVYAAALEAAGDLPRAIDVLEEAHRAVPADRRVLEALAGYEEQRGNTAAARRWLDLLNR